MMATWLIKVKNQSLFLAEPIKEFNLTAYTDNPLRAVRFYSRRHARSMVGKDGEVVRLIIGKFYILNEKGDRSIYLY
jgi:hypothetical protein